MNTYYLKPGKDRSGNQNYILSSPDKKIPKYFESSSSARTVAHDIVDHLVYYDKVHSIVDELIAIGVAYYRDCDKDSLRGDIVELLYSFYAQAASLYRSLTIYEGKEEIVWDEVTIHEHIHRFTDNYFRFDFKGDIIDHIAETIDSIFEDDFLYELELWANENEYVRKTLYNTINKGYELAKNTYGSPIIATRLYKEIQSKLIDIFDNEDIFTVKDDENSNIHVRININRQKGSVYIDYKYPHEQRYYTKASALMRKYNF